MRLHQINAKTGIRAGNLSYHYSSKEAIVSAVYQEVFEGLTQMLMALLNKKTFATIMPCLKPLKSSLQSAGSAFAHQFPLLDSTAAQKGKPATVGLFKKTL